MIEESDCGRNAMNTIRQWPPDVILTEYWLSLMNGVEMLRTVRTDKGPLRFTPIIMVSAETRREKVIAARNAGVTEYIAKPITAKDMLLRIREAIERPRPFVDSKAYFDPIAAAALRLWPGCRSSWPGCVPNTRWERRSGGPDAGSNRPVGCRRYHQRLWWTLRQTLSLRISFSIKRKATYVRA